MISKVILRKQKEASVIRQHPWIFSGAIYNIDKDIEDDSWVQVYSADNKILGTGFYKKSSIAVKLISFNADTDINSIIDKNIKKAIQHRQKTLKSNRIQTNAFRLIFAESDNLPGLIADYYNGTVVLQFHAKAMYDKLDIISESIRKYLPEVNCIYNKSKRTLSEKDIEDGIIFGEKTADEIIENDLKFSLNIPDGQKTGFFIDQRDNRQLLKTYCKNKQVLNAFSYSGGFSVYALAGGAEFVDSIDISKSAIEILDKNIQINGFEDKHNSYCEDIFSFFENNDKSYDIIILDPPAFAKRRDVSNNAIQAYKRINAIALNKLKPGGMLFTFSCSQYITRDTFTSTVRAAAIETGRKASIIHWLSQASDHKVSIFFPEGEYLKGLVLVVD